MILAALTGLAVLLGALIAASLFYFALRMSKFLSTAQDLQTSLHNTLGVLARRCQQAEEITAIQHEKIGKLVETVAAIRAAQSEIEFLRDEVRTWAARFMALMPSGRPALHAVENIRRASPGREVTAAPAIPRDGFSNFPTDSSPVDTVTYTEGRENRPGETLVLESESAEAESARGYSGDVVLDSKVEALLGVGN